MPNAIIWLMLLIGDPVALDLVYLLSSDKIIICDWILESRPNRHTRPIPILLAQLMATFVHYTFTVPVSGLVDQSAFLERLLLTLYIHD